MKINHLTSAEENLMKLFWKLESFYLKDIMEQHPEPKPHQNTVSTYLKILVEKGYLSTEKEGRIFKYTAIVPLEEYRKFLLRELSHNFFDNSGREILNLLLHENLISQETLKEFNPSAETKPLKVKEEFEYANEILNPKKDKKKGKEKEKDKEKKKKKKKEKE
ncbi:MAG: BlaI/MecI/CopY family transcriptional regulator [Chlorobi bacterium]|uniref:BlaI/MecI/CopY family transcriptional regulator n=1 Tax=Chryseobacterium indicum TaxID=2766954 RepID=A0ABS9C4J4_9FLAO|nr:BlaI/MecI/CopY family transcriptional regulator [Chryseobacterium sp. PS-8]MCF2219210.1 BlaI/MecI/CopY family transcriptional regulator [Chryseobacterium sp. PS-8]NPA09353.1 BlaI/MecI/CopY family transcriptional regulator [Chlorobiota bacterium]